MMALAVVHRRRAALRRPLPPLPLLLLLLLLLLLAVVVAPVAGTARVAARAVAAVDAVADVAGGVRHLFEKNQRFAREATRGVDACTSSAR